MVFVAVPYLHGALVISKDGARLYVANAGSQSVSILSAG
jgi:DNA-binding beta-propeller fold protein YncE